MKQTLQNKIARFLAALGLALMPLVAVAPQVAHGQLINEYLDSCPDGTGVRCNKERELKDIFITVINWALGFAFIIAVIVLIYGGFRYILSAGNEEGAKTGRTAIFNALIGIVIIVLSFVIVQIVYGFVSGTN